MTEPGQGNKRTTMRVNTASLQSITTVDGSEEEEEIRLMVVLCWGEREEERNGW